MKMIFKNYRKWIFAISAPLILSFEAFSGVPPPVTTVGPASLSEGTYSVPVTVSGFNNVGNISLSLYYNAAELVYTGVTLNSVFQPARAIITPVTDQSGLFRFSYISGTPIVLGAPAGTLITLTFTARAGVQGVRSTLRWSTLQGACDMTPPSPGSFVPVITVANMSNYFIRWIY